MENKTPSAIAQEIKQMAARLLELFPSDHSISLYARRAGNHELAIQKLPSYEAATNLLRSLGIGNRSKQVHDPADPWSVVMGDLEGLEISCYCSGLPPTCRKVKKTERLPKTQVVTTGDFVEIEREVIECGQEQDHSAEIVEQAAEIINEPATSN